MSQKAAKTNGSVTGCSVSCARHTLPAKEELQNSFQASEGNFGLDPTQPGWIPSAAFVIQVLTSPWMANTLLQLMRHHQAFQLPPSHLSELEKTEEAWTIQVEFSSVWSATSQGCSAAWRKLCIKPKLTVITWAFLKAKYRFWSCL